MAQDQERHEVNSWALALEAGMLAPDQVLLLQAMVDEGKVSNLKTAADFLDWQGEVFDPFEHMYGH